VIDRVGADASELAVQMKATSTTNRMRVFFISNSFGVIKVKIHLPS